MDESRDVEETYLRLEHLTISSIYIYQYLTICSSIVQAHAESEILSAAEDISAILGVSNTVKHLDVPGSLLSPLPFKVFRPTTKLGVDSGGI